MDAIKKERKALRTAFSRAHIAFAAKVESDCSREEKFVVFQFLEAKMMELDAVHDRFNREMFKSDATEEEVDKELEVNDAYKTKFLMSKMKMSSLTASAVFQKPGTSLASIRDVMKLPSIELPKFKGNVREWLPFWSQFRKIHDDLSVDVRISSNT